MKHFAFLIFIFLSYKISMYGQESGQNNFTIDLSTGFVNYASSDGLLNYYVYSGNSFFPVKLQGCYNKNKNVLLLSMYFSTSRMYPKNLHDAFYEYNRIRNWNSELNLEFYRKVAHLKNIRFFLGIANNTYLFIQEEFYNNLLYEYSPGYRKSYDYSPLNISLVFLCDLKFHENYLYLKSGYTIFNLSARPDDNFVKQFGLGSHAIWKNNTPENIRIIQSSVYYKHNFRNNFGLTAEYNIGVYSFKSLTAHKYLRNLFLAGISKTF